MVTRASSFPSFTLGALGALGALGLAACGDDVVPSEPLPPEPPAVRAVVVAGDFNATGVLSLVDVDAGTIREKVLAGVAGADPVIRRLGAELFVVNRFGPTGSNVTVLDEQTLAVRHQLSTGANTNPQDVAVIGERLYLPALGTAGVVVLERSGARSLIDLSGLDPDGKPDCVSAWAVGSELVVVCGVLEGFSAVRNAKVAIYDTVSGAVRVGELAARNPVGFLQPTPTDSVFAGDLLIATADFGDPQSQCVLRLDPRTARSRCAIDNAALGGIANHLGVHPKTGNLLATGTYYDDMFRLRGALRAINLGTGAVAPSPLSAASYAIADFAVCPDGAIVTTDAAVGATGVRIYRDGQEQTTAPLPIGLPPVPQNGVVCF